MRATLLYAPGDVRVETVDTPRIEHPTDAIVRMVRTCVCGSDLHPFHSMDPVNGPARMGHELLGVVEEVGKDVRKVSPGDLVITSFHYQDDTCVTCVEDFAGACPAGGFLSDCQSEATRVPLADGTLSVMPVGEDQTEILPSLLTLADVYGTGHHAAVMADVRAGDTVAVVGDGAVGLLAVLAARKRGAEQIILMGRHRVRTDLGREFGATDVVAERGDEGVEMVRELTGGRGVRAVLEAVGHMPAYEQSVGIVRPGGVISRVGVPQYSKARVGPGSLFGRNIQLAGSPAPVHRYVAELLPGIMDGTDDPGRVFDRTVGLDDVPEGYRAMDAREALKVMVTP